MKNIWLFAITIGLFAACKNSGQNTASKKKADKPKLDKVIVDANRPASGKPDIRVLDWAVMSDTLRVIVNYTGGCEEHSFKAYFSGGWLKSLPPQAMIEIEHLNPVKDHCRALVRDTAYFDLSPVRYSGQERVVVKWQANPEKSAMYTY